MTAETQFSETPAESFSPDGSLSPDGSPGLFPVSRNNGLLLAAAGGLAQAATLPKLGAWPLVFLCLIPLYWAIRSQPLRRAFLFGWVYGLALGLGSFYWLAEVMAGYGGLGAGGFVVLLLLAAFMALHQALWAWLTAPWVRTGNLGLTGPLAGAFFWIGLDYIKNWIFTGFNWSPLAAGLALRPQLMGLADILGLYGLGLFPALTAGWLSFANPRQLKKSLPLVLASVSVLVILVWYGSYTYNYYEEAAHRSPQKKAAVLQPSVDQNIKWDPVYRDQILERISLLAARAERQKPWLTFWSETAAPFSYGYDELETQWLNRLLQESSLTMLVGLTALEPDQSGVIRLYNRAWLMTPLENGPYYDKRHLVPFGEYVPFSEELPFLKWAFFQGVLGAAGTYSPGRGRNNLLIYDQVQIGVMICFESIFPYLGRDRTWEGADILAVTTNDSWFGDSWAPEQHLYQAAWRAAENRRPLIRAANSGISALILPSGRIAARSPQNAVDTYIFSLPVLAPRDKTLTFFTRTGHRFARTAGQWTIGTAVLQLVIYILVQRKLRALKEPEPAENRPRSRRKPLK